jgi:hypothetical protein
MSRYYKRPQDRKTLWDEPMFVAALIFATVFIAYFIARVNGWHVSEKDVVCTKGREAYVIVYQKLRRSEAMDYVCKK